MYIDKRKYALSFKSNLIYYKYSSVDKVNIIASKSNFKVESYKRDIKR